MQTKAVKKKPGGGYKNRRYLKAGQIKKKPETIKINPDFTVTE